MVLSETTKKTEAEYFAMDLESEGMLEFYDGRVVVKDRSSTFDHSRIGANLIGEIGKFLKGKNSRAFYYKLRETTPSGNAYMYPDVTIVCGKALLKKDCFDTVTNLSVIMEIMTDATRNIDMGSKFWYSIQIPTLKEYILVDSTRYHVITARRQAEDTWQFIVTEGIDSSITINTIEMELPLRDIYDEVSFD